ncbi:hypothetical protein ACFB49_33570 [Sphingomonas sp. DBB INV C78]|uniref:DUF6894 family protein n=1 Tax=Sphingomonas sp. DBB INV C78 TaxID=3349434 RepID=UPI0036D43614
MAMFFFHLTEGDEVIPDTEGLDRADLAAVEKEAVAGASALVAEAVQNGETDYWGRLDVENVSGERLLSLTFACSIHIDNVRAQPGCTESPRAHRQADRLC